MYQPVNPDERDPSVTAVAAVSLVAGLACTLVPAATERFAGVDTTPGALRAVGLAASGWPLQKCLCARRPARSGTHIDRTAL
jgi:hypothetical protein